MSVLQIVSDCWDDVLNHEELVEKPTTTDFDRLLDRMDGKIYTMLVLKREVNVNMGIGGGGDRYVVYATFDDETFWNLIAPERASGRVILNAGGQEGEYPTRQVVTRDQARQAGHTFLVTGDLDRSLHWEMQ